MPTGEWWHPYHQRMLKALRRSDPAAKQVGGPWNDVVYQGKRFWPRYCQEDGVLFLKDFQPGKLKEAGIAGILCVSLEPGTRVWLVPTDRLLNGVEFVRRPRALPNGKPVDGIVKINYKKWGRSV